MCGIGGLTHLGRRPCDDLGRVLATMNDLQRHRGPDGQGVWMHPRQVVGFAHRRLSIIDIDCGRQPMHDGAGNWVTFNGEIYNYVELREELGVENFRTNSDTEVILQAYRRWGSDCVDHLRGMFAFALWDEAQQTLLCARDRFGIKPFYYAVVGERLYFASEIKALLPFLPTVGVDREGLSDYLTFQFYTHGKTLFAGVRELLPGHVLEVSKGQVRVERYWQVYYELDRDHTASYFEERVGAALADSVRLHLRADVPVGAYLSGGVDSSLVTSLACAQSDGGLEAYTGKFLYGEKYDESQYARAVAQDCHIDIREVAITADDFIRTVGRVIYHLDQPVAGPGSFPQYMVSELAAKHRKVVLGGQGGDEIFGGYTRYLVAYFDQCIRGAVEGTLAAGNFDVSFESIIPNLASLRNYKPLLQDLWREGAFETLDRRYFRLVNRGPDLGDAVRWRELGDYSPLASFDAIFRAPNVPRDSYFESMTHFDFKTLLPALLQVEDRVSMAHGLESRVPLVDHPLVELVATIPPEIKFARGELKGLLRKLAQPLLPQSVLARKDKMGFPVPLAAWCKQEARDFVRDLLGGQAAASREFIDNHSFLERLDREGEFSRQAWGLICLELWQQTFVDRAADFRQAYDRATLDPSALVTAEAASQAA